MLPFVLLFFQLSHGISWLFRIFFRYLSSPSSFPPVRNRWTYELFHQFHVGLFEFLYLSTLFLVIWQLSWLFLYLFSCLSSEQLSVFVVLGPIYLKELTFSIVSPSTSIKALAFSSPTVSLFVVHSILVALSPTSIYHLN